MFKMIENIAQEFFKNSSVEVTDRVSVCEYDINTDCQKRIENISLYAYSFAQGVQEIKEFRPSIRYENGHETIFNKGNIPCLENYEYVFVRSQGHQHIETRDVSVDIETSVWNKVSILTIGDFLRTLG